MAVDARGGGSGMRARPASPVSRPVLRSAPGHLLWVLGPNGSGKTSLLRLLCGCCGRRPEPCAGTARRCARSGRASTPSLLYLGHAPAVKDDLSGRENLRFGLAQSGVAVTPHEAAAALSEFGLAGREELPARALSQGQKRRVGAGATGAGAARRCGSWTSRSRRWIRRLSRWCEIAPRAST